MAIGAIEIQQRMAAFAGLCRRHGIKETHQRTEIYRELARSNQHPDAESVYLAVRRRIPSISLDTVYRTLRLLEEQGVIWRVGTLRERTRFDGNTQRHHHFVCRECGKVTDFHHEDLDKLSPPQEAAALGAIEYMHVELRGICAACRAKRTGSRER